MLLLAPLAGSIIDRLPRVKVMVAADLVRVALAATLALRHDSAALAYAVAFGLSAGQARPSPPPPSSRRCTRPTFSGDGVFGSDQLRGFGFRSSGWSRRALAYGRSTASGRLVPYRLLAAMTARSTPAGTSVRTIVWVSRPSVIATS